MSAKKLDYRVLMHSYPGFNSTSTLFYGERDAILIDATQLLSDAHRLAAELIEMGKNLTHIYVSHFHPDHHFGAGVLKAAFPRAHVVALPSVVKDIIFTTNDKVDMWGEFFGPNEPETVLFPMPMSEPRLECEGHVLEFSDGWEGDSVNNSVVWAPSLNLACATDVAYLDCHIWMTESNAARREQWRASIRELRRFGADVIIPGHVSAEKLALRDTSCVEWSLRYLDTYEQVLASAKTGADLWEGMNNAYPGMKAMDFAIQWNARLLFPHSCPDWFPALPGRPGAIFLDPQGEFIGEGPRD
jgi:glyoxylase-like metal-dependent hydrolase (beta-lactamase superfamily II)